MRNDILKVIHERQRGGSRERSFKTGMKIQPKFFESRICHNSFEDFRLHMLEICDEWEDPNVINGTDYTFDGDATFVSSARRREYGWDCKRRNENTRALYRSLEKNVGRLWNDVYSEFCATVDRRSKTGYRIFDNLKWAVAKDILMWNGKPYQSRWGRRERWWDYPYSGLYVHPKTGVLCYNERVPYVRPDPEVESIKISDNTWYVLEVLKDRNLECGCRHFKIPPPADDKNASRYYRRYPSEPAVCCHGNEPTPRPIWYVITFSWHQPDEVYKVIHHYDFEAARYGLKSGETHKIYYRDVPEILRKPIVFHKKVANKKELQFIRQYIGNGGVNQGILNITTVVRGNCDRIVVR